MPRHQQSRNGPGRDYPQDTPRSRYAAEDARVNPRGEYRGEYGADFAGERPERLRDSWSERQSGPYRSALNDRPLSEDDYREESRHYRSQPYTGFSGRVSEFGYEDPTWGTPQMGRQGPPSGMHFSRPGESHRGHGPRDYARSDQRIKEDICDELSDDEQCDAREIDIDVSDAKVTLSGTVPARYMKHLAEDIADETRGVKDVDNRIRVDRRAADSSGESYAAGANPRYTAPGDGGSAQPASESHYSSTEKKA